MVSNRDISVDILRGIAILTMMAPNLAASILVEPHPFWLRVYGSFAAPLFILISGMMVVLTSRTRAHGLRYFMLRGGMLVAVGVLIDILIWNIYPFTTFDVLYLIGISLPIAYLFLRLNSSVRWIAIILIFALTPILHTVLGYAAYPTEINLLGQQTVVVVNETGIFNHWLVDGWFPVFPWLAFSLLGVNLGELRWSQQRDSHTIHSFGSNLILLVGVAVLSIGAILWWLYPGSLLTRAGYSELFYPPTTGYAITAIGVIIILFSIVDRRPSFSGYRPLRVLGEFSLLIYILHLALIEYIINLVWGEVDLQTFLLIYVALSVFIVLIAYWLRKMKERAKHRHFIVRFLFGA
jgi:uncharacterized membrane protein